MDSRPNSASPEPPPRECALWMVAAVVFVLGILARSVYLEELPAYIHNDESATAIYITPPFFNNPPDPIMFGQNNYGGHANFGAWLASLYLRAFGGKTLWAIRMGSMVCGVLSLLFGALLVRSWLGLRAMVFFLAAVVPFHLHIHYSRTGFIYMQAALFVALVGYLFASFARKPSLLNGLLLGVTTGFSLMVYSATQVLLGVLSIGVPVVLLSKTSREYYGKAAVAKGIGAALAVVAGTAISFGSFVYHAYTGGFSSRFLAQSIFQGHLGRSLVQELWQDASLRERVTENLKSTASFFWAGDASNQYGFIGPMLENISYTVVLFGCVVLLYRCVRFDAVALFVTALSVATIIGSGLMIEKNFSPHFVAFGLILPMVGALGLETACRFLRLRAPLWGAGIAILLFIPWSYWNCNYYLGFDSRKRNLDTFILQLPIARESVKNVVNYTPLITDFSESFYMLRYPHTKFVKRVEVPNLDVMSDATAFITPPACPCLLILPHEQYAGFIQSLISSNRGFKEFSFDPAAAKMVYVE